MVLVEWRKEEGLKMQNMRCREIVQDTEKRTSAKLNWDDVKADGIQHIGKGKAGNHCIWEESGNPHFSEVIPGVTSKACFGVKEEKSQRYRSWDENIIADYY